MERKIFINNIPHFDHKKIKRDCFISYENVTIDRKHYEGKQNNLEKMGNIYDPIQLVRKRKRGEEYSSFTYIKIEVDKEIENLKNLLKISESKEVEGN